MSGISSMLSSFKNEVQVAAKEYKESTGLTTTTAPTTTAASSSSSSGSIFKQLGIEEEFKQAVQAAKETVITPPPTLPEINAQGSEDNTGNYIALGLLAVVIGAVTISGNKKKKK